MGNNGEKAVFYLSTFHQVLVASRWHRAYFEAGVIYMVSRQLYMAPALSIIGFLGSFDAWFLFRQP